jgi:DNA-binding MltR family transcriptional regulator
LGDPDSKPKTLRDLRKEIPSTDDIMRRLAMAQLASDYEAAMLSASLLEYMLMQAIRTKFIPLGQEFLDSLFSDVGNGPLSTFSAKIKLSYALGIVSPETRSHMERVRTIRNHFAHHKDRTTFDETIVKDECEKLKQLKTLTISMKELRERGLTPKLRYVQTCFFICTELIDYVRFPGHAHRPIDAF